MTPERFFDQSEAAIQKAHADRLFPVGALLAASFIGAPFIEAPRLFEALWKASGIFVLGGFAFSRGARLAGAGLAASSVGDFALHLEPTPWTAGMAAFALAHGFYFAAFARRFQASVRGWIFATLTVGASLCALFWFLPDMGGLRVAGGAYHGVISIMVAAALVSDAPRAARIGAVLFLASDVVIALELFKGLGPFGALNWILYAPAQILIAFGLSSARRESAPKRAH